MWNSERQFDDPEECTRTGNVGGEVWLASAFHQVCRFLSWSGVLPHDEIVSSRCPFALT
jgi:hypothetical protein